ncbi:MAG TPA: phenylalanine--tRNA ligase subunit alpha [Spirochaetota bacterium]|nr:phenylalanine--tRNA ligase subunit alpha [Spirochaetota bacterium]
MILETDTVINNLKNALQKADSVKAVQQVKTRFLGKKGTITAAVKKIGALPPEKRRDAGQKLNQIKKTAETLIKDKMNNLQTAGAATPSGNTAAIKMPGRSHSRGSIHPLTIIKDEIISRFNKMGFLTVEGPEIEKEYYNFEALNIPAYHPARDTQDSFYIQDDYLLRTQTSPVQPRIMEKTPPPIAVVCPGRVFRRDTVDASHSPVFHQIEGLFIDKNISMADLKGLLHHFCKSMFGEDVKIRFRPDYFPFTEPSCEIAISCPLCKGSGCSTCQNEGWIEILGAGLVNPKVLSASGIDPEVYSGLAFGMGIERIAMIKYSIPDIRLFFDNNYKFLKQFV